MFHDFNNVSLNFDFTQNFHLINGDETVTVSVTLDGPFVHEYY